jgi:hypothetical protein
MAELWEKQRGESRQAFQAFAIYRDMGPERSYAKTAQRLGKSKKLMDDWGRKWSWQVRVEAWDQELDQKARDEQIRALADMNDRHAKQARLFQSKALQRLNMLQIDELSPSDLIKFFEVAAKVERLAMGEPTENQNIKGTLEQKVTQTGRVEHEHNIADAIKSNPDLQRIAVQLFRGIKRSNGGGTGEDMAGDGRQ